MRKALHKLTQRHHFADGQSYDRHAGRVFGGMYRRVAEEVAIAAPPGGVLLDAGCGTGQLAVEIAVQRPDLCVLGVDLESGMVDAAPGAPSERASPTAWSSPSPISLNCHFPTTPWI